MFKIHGEGPLDLHISGTPPAFILSQDQTLKEICRKSICFLGQVALSTAQLLGLLCILILLADILESERLQNAALEGVIPNKHEMFDR